MTYEEFKLAVDGINVRALELSIGQNVPRAFHDGSYHEITERTKTLEHKLDVFNVSVKVFPINRLQNEAEIEFKWRYCPQCKQVRNKSLIGFYKPENMAYVRELINKGAIV